MIDKILKVTHGSEKKPLKIADMEIDCYVLEGGMRVFSQRGLNKVFGITHGGRTEGGRNLPRFIGAKPIEPFISNELAAGINSPVKYLPPHGGISAEGLPAEILPAICDVWLKAREAGVLKTERQLGTARKAEILVRGFANVGIIALVDEATGYQKERPLGDLQKILEIYIAKELLPWTKKFPDNYYEQLFRLNGWQYNPASVKRPKVAGKMTEDIIYRLLPPGVLEEIKAKNPKDAKGRRKHKHHQLLSEQIGIHHLEKQIAAVVTLMRISPNWRRFKSFLNRAFPKPNQQFELLEDTEED